MPNSPRLVAAGLFFVTAATLILEILDSRLLSVVTWYHLAFLAVSLAMLGMAAGACSCSCAEPPLQQKTRPYAPCRAIARGLRSRSRSRTS